MNLKNETETEMKLRDAMTQFQLAINHIDNEDYFRSCINSFISFARSVTMVMERESSKNEELFGWYKAKTAEFASDPLMRFFNEQRVHTIHRGNVRPRAESVPLRNRPKAADPNDEPTMQIWIFDNAKDFLPNETGNAVRLCDHYLQTLTTLVNDWRYLKAVTETPRELIQVLENQARRLQGQVVWMRSELDQAKMTLELLNDMLKRKGEHSEDSFVRELVLRIERVLYPEKFANAPAVRTKGTITLNDSGALNVYTILLSPTEADSQGAEGVYATIRNDYAKDELGKPIFDKEFGFWMWGVNLKGELPSPIAGFGSAKEAEEAALRIYKLLRY